jgi:hypothetical protein
MDYHKVYKYLIFSDFGGYLIRLKFNIEKGDLEKDGKVYDDKFAKEINNVTVDKAGKGNSDSK